MDDTFPLRTRKTVSGLSMWRLMWAGRACSAVTGVATASACVVMLVTDSTFDNPWVVALCGILAASAGVGFLFLRVGDKRKDAEFAEGYTTSRVGYPNLEQVDESTGFIVRAAGEPLLTRQEHRARMLAFRASLVES
ncbi:hypothetical protein JF66_12905 [Cryobacterium sp. MLB-32]|uniref:hypothetical protein n=1 Tax=Cryobacterium sp. MLB-32 TaxID=1529318 RepID=UPI0004E772EE|nr:hypothetical protein [Cryobacterium sp. MLB-32]KFF59206.1 hypothetical protein JF66_12905 [Cryobacterium sp. MLB-32]